MIGEIIGQEISVNVPKNMKAQVIPQGNSYQATREGYNLFDYLNKVENGGGLTYTLDKETGYITVNGTPEWDYTTCVKSFEINDLLEDGKTYSIWQEVYSDTTIGGLYCQVAIKPKTDGNIQYINSSQSRVNFIVDKNQYNYNMMLQIGTIAIAGTFNNYKNRYMLYEGTDNKTFELYGVSPSLNYPSEVEAVGDNINLFDGEKLENKGYSQTTGELQDDNTTYCNKNIIPISQGKVIVQENGKSVTTRLFFYDNEKNYISNAKNDNEIVEIPSNARYMNFQIGKASVTDWNKFKIEIGETITPYSSYGQGSVEIVKSNKNILDWLDLLNKIGITLPYTKEVSGITFKIDEKGTISVKGTSTSTISLYLTGSYTSKVVKYIINNAKDTIASGFNNNWSKGLTGVFLDNSSETNIHLDFYDSKNNKCTKDKFNVTGIMFGLNSGVTIDEKYNLMLEKATIATNFIEHQGNTYTLPIQKPFYKIGDYVDNFIKQNNKWYEQHYIKELILTGEESIDRNTVFENSVMVNTAENELYNPYVPTDFDATYVMCNMLKATSRNDCYSDISVGGKTALGNTTGRLFITIANIETGVLSSDNDTTMTNKIKTWLQELYNAGTPIKIYYVLATPELIECTEEQTQILEQLNNLYLYEGINYLYSTDDLSPIFQFSYDKIVNDFKFYLSENGRLIFPKENISFLCSISESTIPVMPEALETSAIIAGRDGDVPLETTYGPMSFELVLYTEDNLEPNEKLQQQQLLTKFCNLIKNNTETFALELSQKFYKIKYNGVLDRENYPKHLRIVFPFKSSKSYAYNLKKNIKYGNTTFTSETIEPCGFECIIKGPALKPIISLNNYSIEYTNTILDGESLIIDTNNSTAILVNAEGIETNAMRYYNHQFPKIQNGENKLKVLSGIDNENNVSISWYDLTL